MNSKIPILKNWSVLGILLLVSLGSLYWFYNIVSLLIEQLISNSPVISFRSGFYGTFGAGFTLLIILLAVVLEYLYKGKTPPKLLNIVGKISIVSFSSIFVLPLMISFLIPPYLESLQYRYCNVPYRGAMFPLNVYTNSPKSCIEVLKIDCSKAGRNFEPCILRGMVEYREFIRIE